MSGRSWEYMIYFGGQDGLAQQSEIVTSITPARRQDLWKDKEMDKLGMEGWECYHVDHSPMQQVYFLKRQL